MKTREEQRQDLWAAIVIALPEGRANAISVAELGARVRRFDPMAAPGKTYKAPPMASSSLRAHVHAMQESGYAILTSPRAGIWIADDEAERIDVMDELRERITAIEQRIALINGGKCALRTCRATLPPHVAKRGGLYCQPEHRYLAAAARKHQDPPTRRGVESAAPTTPDTGKGEEGDE